MTEPKRSEAKRIYDLKYDSEHRQQRKDYSKEYYNEHKDEINAKCKAYRLANPELMRAKIVCDICGATISKHGLSKHKKAIKCILSPFEQH